VPRPLPFDAVRVAEFTCRTIGVTVKASFARHPSMLMNLVEFHRLTGQRSHLTARNSSWTAAAVGVGCDEQADANNGTDSEHSPFAWPLRCKLRGMDPSAIQR